MGFLSCQTISNSISSRMGHLWRWLTMENYSSSTDAQPNQWTMNQSVWFKYIIMQIKWICESSGTLQLLNTGTGVWYIQINVIHWVKIMEIIHIISVPKWSPLSVGDTIALQWAIWYYVSLSCINVRSTCISAAVLSRCLPNFKMNGRC